MGTNIPPRSGERKQVSCRFQWEQTRKYRSEDHRGGTKTVSDVLKGGAMAAAPSGLSLHVSIPGGIPEQAE